MIIDLPTGQPKLRFTVDIFEVTLIYSLITGQYNAWVSAEGGSIVEGKGLTLNTDILEDTQYTQKIETVHEATIESIQLQLSYKR